MMTDPVAWCVTCVALVVAAVAVATGRRRGHRTEPLRRELAEHEAVERALRESEQRYRQMFEHNRAVKLLIDPATGAIVDANAAACDFYGYPRERLTRMRIGEINTLPPERLAGELARVAKGETGGLRFAHRLASGEVRRVEVRSGPIEAGGRKLLFSIIHDVTEQVRAESALREREARFRAVFEGTQDGIGVSCDGAYVMGNPACLRMLGYDSDEGLTGRPLLDFVAPEERERVADYARRRDAGGDAPTSYETVAVRRDGSRFAMEVRPSTYLEDGKRYTIALMRDITERKRQEEEVGRLLVERERLIAELQEQRERVPLPCLVLGLDERITYWNPAAERVFGWRRDDAIGRDAFTLLVAPEQRARVRADAGKLGTTLNENVTRDGRTIICEWHSVPLVGADGAPYATLWLAHDLTERHRLEDQLRQAQKMDAIGRLAGGVAHDFNNLLTVVTGYGELLQQGLEPAHALRAHADQMLKAAWRAAQLTRQLLAFGRRQVLQPRIVDLNAVVADMGKLLRRVIGEHIELVTELATDLGRVRADAGQLEQVLMNLVLNARDAMPDGGRLTISTGEVRLERETPDLHAGQWVRVRVADTGHGIDPAARARLFEPFFTTKPAGKGTGLGLATAYGIIAQSGGTILVESEAGKGAAFSVLLPRAEAEATTATPAAGARVQLDGRGTILLIEDEPQLRELVRVTLAGAGYDLIEAADGEQALRVLERIGEHIDLVVTDVIMPRLGGPQVVAKMAELRVEAPVVYMSGYAEGQPIDDALRVGRARLLEKPFTREALLSAVRAALEGDGGATEPRPGAPAQAG